VIEEMKLLGMMASGRKKGNSSLLLSLALESAVEAGAEASTINLTEYHIKPCTGCMTCVLNQRPCPLEDDMTELLAQIQDVQGLILAAPTYVLSPAAITKLLADRFMMNARKVNDKCYKGVAATITTAGLPTMNPLGEILNVIPLTFQLQMVDYLAAYGPGPGEPLLDDQTVARAKELGKRIVAVWRGEGAKLAAAKDQCPCCYSRAFNLAPGGKLACCICGSKACPTANESGGWALAFEPGWEENNRFSPSVLSHHVFDWIIGSKDRYLAKLPEILAKGILPGKKG
jgi:multimeric flavodoxin WrbA